MEDEKETQQQTKEPPRIHGKQNKTEEEEANPTADGSRYVALVDFPIPFPSYLTNNCIEKDCPTCTHYPVCEAYFLPVAKKLLEIVKRGKLWT